MSSRTASVPTLTATAQKRVAAKLAVDALGSALKGMTDAKLAKLGTDRATVGLMFATILNYGPVPSDYWSDALPDRSFAGGRGTANRLAKIEAAKIEAATAAKSAARKSSAAKRAARKSTATATATADPSATVSAA